jgi:hypothetical protein
MERHLYETRQQDHGTFYCPNGHGQHFTGKTDDERRIAALERQLKQAQENAASAWRQREWAEKQTKSANIKTGIAQASLRRLRHRVACGVCPECHRTFKQLAAHIKSKHGAKY